MEQPQRQKRRRRRVKRRTAAVKVAHTGAPIGGDDATETRESPLRGGCKGPIGVRYNGLEKEVFVQNYPFVPLSEYKQFLDGEPHPTEQEFSALANFRAEEFYLARQTDELRKVTGEVVGKPFTPHIHPLIGYKLISSDAAKEPYFADKLKSKCRKYFEGLEDPVTIGAYPESESETDSEESSDEYSYESSAESDYSDSEYETDSDEESSGSSDGGSEKDGDDEKEEDKRPKEKSVETVLCRIVPKADGNLFHELQRVAGKFGKPARSDRVLYTKELAAIAFQMAQGLHQFQTKAHGRHLALHPAQILLTAPEKGDTALHAYEFGLANDPHEVYVAVAAPELWDRLNERERFDALENGVLRYTLTIDDAAAHAEFELDNGKLTTAQKKERRKNNNFTLDKPEFDDDEGIGLKSTTDNPETRKSFRNQAMLPFVQTSAYRPPAEYFTVPAAQSGSARVMYRGWGDDAYSLGLILLEMLTTGAPAPPDQDDRVQGWVGSGAVYTPGGTTKQGTTMHSLLDIDLYPKGMDNGVRSRMVSGPEAAIKRLMTLVPMADDARIARRIINLCMLQRQLGNGILPSPETWPKNGAYGLEKSELYAALAKQKEVLEEYYEEVEVFWEHIVSNITKQHDNSLRHILAALLTWTPDDAERAKAWDSVWSGSLGIDEPRPKSEMESVMTALAVKYLKAGDASATAAAKRLLTPLYATQRNRDYGTFSWSDTTARHIELKPISHWRVYKGDHTFIQSYAENTNHKSANSFTGESITTNARALPEIVGKLVFETRTVTSVKSTLPK